MASLRELENRFKKAGSDIIELREVLFDVNEVIASLSSRWIDWNYKKHDAERISFATVIDESIEDIQQIIKSEMELAFLNAVEFSQVRYRNILLSAIKDSDKLLSISGSYGLINVTSNFEEELGTIEDYANGILFAREIIFADKHSGNIRRLGGYWASIYWGEIYNQNDIAYSYTVALRLEGFKSKAPWWNIINDGTPPSLPSDRDDGGFNPIDDIPPTHFVDKIVRRAEDLLRSRYDSRENDYINMVEGEQRRLDAEILKYDDLRERISTLLPKDFGYIEREEPDETEKLEKTAKKLIEDSLTENQRQRGKQEKLDELIKKISAGEYVRDRVYIGGGAYKRTIQLRREFEAIKNV